MEIDLQGTRSKTRILIQGRILLMLLPVGRSSVLVPSILVVAVLDETVSKGMQVVVFNAERSEF